MLITPKSVRSGEVALLPRHMDEVAIPTAFRDVTWREMIERDHKEAIYADPLFSALKVGEAVSIAGRVMYCKSKNLGRSAREAPYALCVYANEAGLVEVEITADMIPLIRPVRASRAVIRKKNNKRKRKGADE